LYLFSIATPTPLIHPLSLHDALPIFSSASSSRTDQGCAASLLPDRRKTSCNARMLELHARNCVNATGRPRTDRAWSFRDRRLVRSEEHTSELQSRVDLVCRLLLEKKK